MPERGIYYPDGTFKNDEQIKREQALKGELPIIETPKTAPRSFEYWSNRFRKRQEEWKETSDIETDHVTISFKGETIINLIGDIHAGSPLTRYNRLEQELTAITNKPNSYVILVGDVIDGFFFNPAQMGDMEQPPEQFMYMKSLVNHLAENRRLLIGFSGDHDCLDSETEVLTNRGWLKYNQIKLSDKVLTHLKSGEVKWVKPSHIHIFNHDGKMYHWKGASINILCTNNHRLYFKTRRKDVILFEAMETFSKRQDPSMLEIVKSGLINNPEYPIEDRFISLCGWLLTDGWIGYQNKKAYGVGYCQSESKLHLIMKALKVFTGQYSVRKRCRPLHTICGMKVKTLQPAYEFTLHSPASRKVLSLMDDQKSRLPDWVFKLSKRQFDILLNAMLDGDGSRKKNALMFYNKNKVLIDQLQIACAIFGYRTSIYEYRNRIGGLQYRLNIYESLYERCGQKVKQVNYKGKIWDLTVPDTHNFMVRRGGISYFTGNSWAKKMGYDPYTQFQEIGCYYMSGIGHLTAKVDDIQYRITGAHKLPGFSMYNNVHPEMRASKEIQGADVYFSAHNHIKGYAYQAVKEFGGNARKVHYISLGTYKPTDEWLMKKGFAQLNENEMYGSSIVLKNDIRDIRYYDNILEANK